MIAAASLRPTFHSLMGLLFGVYNAKGYGALGNGSADDRAAIQAAIDAASAAGGGIVHVPPGTYKGGAALKLKSYVTLRGAGRTATTLKLDAAVGATVNIVELSSARQEQVAVEDMTLDGNSVGQHGIFIENDSATNGAFASGFNNPRHRFSNLLIHHTGKDGLRLNGDGFGGACEVISVQTYWTGQNGIYTATPDNVFTDCDVGQAGYAGYRADATNNNLIACKAWLCGRSDALGSVSAFNNCGFVVRSRSRIVACEAQDNARFGFHLFNVTNAEIAGCTADTNGKGYTDAGGTGHTSGVYMDGCQTNSIDLVTFDRRGDSGTDPLIQKFAVYLGNSDTNVTSTKNNVRVAAGVLATQPLPDAHLVSDNTINLTSVSGSPVSRMPHSTASHVDSRSPALGSTVRFESMDRRAVSTGVGLVNGAVSLQYFVAPTLQAMTKFVAVVRGTAAAGTTLARMGLYSVAANGDLTLVARTANNTSLFNATFTVNTQAMDATGGYVTTYTPVVGSAYAIGLIVVGTSTAPVLYGTSINGAIATWDPPVNRKLTGQTDLPASITAASLADDGSLVYAALVP